jgi:hypothetical protein
MNFSLGLSLAGGSEDFNCQTRRRNHTAFLDNALLKVLLPILPPFSCVSGASVAFN